MSIGRKVLAAPQMGLFEGRMNTLKCRHNSQRRISKLTYSEGGVGSTPTSPINLMNANYVPDAPWTPMMHHNTIRKTPKPLELHWITFEPLCSFPEAFMKLPLSHWNASKYSWKPCESFWNTPGSLEALRYHHEPLWILPETPVEVPLNSNETIHYIFLNFLNLARVNNSLQNWV